MRTIFYYSKSQSNIEVIEQNNFGIAIKALNSGFSGQGWIKATFDNSSQIIYEEFHIGVPDYYIYTGDIESQYIEIYYQIWTRLFLNNVYEESGWEWEVDYSNVRPSDTQMILIYPVILSGSKNALGDDWHIWLADGYKEYYEVQWFDNETCEDVFQGSDPSNCGVCQDCVSCWTYSSKQWHMNWGWNGESNGWYNASSNTIGSYDNLMRAYTNIRPL